MLLYTKVIEKDGQQARVVYGTMANVPSEDDQEIVCVDVDGDVEQLVPGDTYVTDGKGGIKRLSDGKAVNVFIKREGEEDFNVIPGNWEPVPAEVKSLKLTGPTKLKYTVGESLDFAGLVVTAVYADGDEKEVSDFVASPAEGFVLETEGEVTVEISFGGKVTSFAVQVAAAPIVEENPDNGGSN